MRPVMARVKLLDRQIIDADQLDSVVNEVLSAVGGDKRVVLDEIALQKKRRVASPKQDSFVTSDGAGTQLVDSNRENAVVKTHQQRRPDQSVQRDLVDGLAVVEEMTRGVDVGARVRAESYRRHIRAGTLG